MKHHPDRNPGDPTATANFQEINKAHEILRDPKERARYDSRKSKENGVYADYGDKNQGWYESGRSGRDWR